MDLDRQEADRQDQRRHRRLNTWILALGVLATVGTLLVTALTLRSGQEQLNVAREGQVTDRYTRAVEQLGSDKREVRIAAIYALERIAADSKRDRRAIRDLLAAFVRERGPGPNVKDDDLPREPATDIAAALTVLSRRPADPRGSPALDLRDIRVPRAPFSQSADLRGADLRGAELRGADLRDADLRAANLRGAKLSYANLQGADLRGAKLCSLDLCALRGGILIMPNLDQADLRRADLRGTGLAKEDIKTGLNFLEGTRFD